MGQVPACHYGPQPQHNVNRQQVAVKQSPEEGRVGQERFPFRFSKVTQEWGARPAMEEKSYDFIHKLMAEAAESKGLKQLVATDLLSSTKDLPKNIAKTPMPPKEELIKKRLQRSLKSASKN